VDHSFNASEVFNKLAELYQSKLMDVSEYASELDNFIRLLPHHHSILEIACGPGNLTKYVLDNTEDAKLLGIDLAPKMIELARQNCPKADFQVMDCRLISSLQQMFDGIIVGFCLPYLDKTEAGKLIEDVSNLMNEGGTIYLSTIEGSYTNSGLKKTSTGEEVFMHYYELGDIESWLSQFGLKPVTKRKVSVINNPNQDIDLIIVAQKQNQ